MAGYTNFASSTNLSLIDPHWDSVVLFVDFDGTDGATSATDESNSAHTLTFNSNAQIDTAQSKFGGSSLLLDGTDDNVSCADSADWQLGTEFTVEAWVRLNTLSANSVICGHNNPTGLQRDWLLRVMSDGQVRLSISPDGLGGSQVHTEGGSLTTATWYHVAATRNADNLISVWVDGVSVASQTSSVAFFNSTASFRVGAQETGSTEELDGWIDSVRITKGVCRYTERFNPPPLAFPAVGPA